MHIFFLGIAGHAMGGLALAAQHRGFTVSGLDETAGPPMSDWLTEHQINWTVAYKPELLDGVDMIVISGHHGKEDHPVIKIARERGIRVVSFAEFLGELTEDKHVIAVAGTHGKTTTTALIAWLFEAAGKRPDYLVGIRPFNFEASSRLDGADNVIIEADEYKASTLDARPKFAYYHPDTLVLTAIEHDHPDIYSTEASYLRVFETLVAGVPEDGQVVACAEGQVVLEVTQKATASVISYGLEKGEYRAANITYQPSGMEFDVVTDEGVIGHLRATLYGRHNVLNALAATVVGLHEGLTLEQIAEGAGGFKGAYRRFNVLTSPDARVTVIDDYAHHPTEVKTTIEAVKLHFPGRRLVVIYRPHTYSRTQALLGEYHQAFGGVDRLFITDVEPAREAADQRTVSGQEIIDGLPSALQEYATFQSDREALMMAVETEARPGDVVLVMTVSGYGNIANDLADKLS